MEKSEGQEEDREKWGAGGGRIEVRGRRRMDRSEGQEEDREKWGAGGGQREVRGRRRTERSEGQEEDGEKWGAGGGQRSEGQEEDREKWGAGGGRQDHSSVGGHPLFSSLIYYIKSHTGALTQSAINIWDWELVLVPE